MSTSRDAVPADSPPPPVRVRVAVGGVRMEFRGRQAFFERHVAPLLPADAGSRKQEGVSVAGGQPPARGYRPASPQRFRRFTQQVGGRARTVDQRIMAFAFYLWNYEKREELRAGDVADFFGTVQETPPADLEQRLEALGEGRRFLVRGSAAGAWRLSPKGVNYVKMRLLAAGG